MRPPPKSRGKLRVEQPALARLIRFNEAPAEKQGKTPTRGGDTNTLRSFNEAPAEKQGKTTPPPGGDCPPNSLQ